MPPFPKQARIGILLVNLGTPDAPDRGAVRRYLKQFLSDPRVVEIPRALWLPILYGIILNTRPGKSAAKYASIWTDEGSPLALYTERQAKLLRGYFAKDGRTDFVIRHAMRYGKPAIGHELDALQTEGCERILVVPLYPQYAGSTTASVMDAIAAWTPGVRNLPELRTLRSYPIEAGYVGALAERVREHWRKHGRAEKLLMSFHGVPRFTVERGDPYQAECLATAGALAAALRLETADYLVTFQSRFGRAEWLQPYTQPTLEALARSGVRSVDVMCPGFVSDCLETLEEITMECKAAYLAEGGQEFRYIPCLNDSPAWITALKTLVTRSTGDWLAESDEAESASATFLQGVPQR
ncbi:ferrochelatase [Niveibacterium sp. SC-1]|uniref:ferrochelatase n=1 Tax=Niveibacterium sp. SC-1 TaxID=3135646 RepID=UPI00311FCDD9